MSAEQVSASRTSIKIDDAPLTALHKRLAVFSAGGPFLDGYILATIGVAMTQITPQLDLSASQAGLIGASILIGMFIGAYAGGKLTDRFGRRVLYMVDLLAIVVCSVAQFWADNFALLFILRLVIGIAVGADYPIATSLLTEFAPRRYRGPLVSFLMVMLFAGGSIAPLVGEMAFAMAGAAAWRWILASAALPAALIVLLRIGTPESPRWLVSQGRIDEARAVLHKAFGPHATIEDIETEERTVSGKTRIRDSGYLGRMVFITVFWTASLVPVYALYAFGPKILGTLGLNGSMANYGSAFINFLFFVGCVAAALVINRMGRRAVLITSLLVSGLALLLLGIFPEAPVTIILLFFAGYAIFIGGAQVLQWGYPNELFPTSIRASATGLAASLSRVGGAVGIYLMPMMLSAIGIGPTMLAAAALTLVGMAYSVVAAPETRSKTLHESSSVSAGRLRVQ